MKMLKLVGILRNGSCLGPRSASSWCMSKHQVVSVACSSTSTANKPVLNETKPVKENSKFPMVKLVFNTLSNENDNKKFADTLASVKTVDDLLNMSEQAHDSPGQMLIIYSTLNQWVEKKIITRKDFENDSRYHMLRLKMKSSPSEKKEHVDRDPDKKREFIPNFTRNSGGYDVEVARLTIKEALDVWTGLTIRGSREKPLLNALAEHLVNKTHKLNMKQHADILYGMAKLNFPNDILLKKICGEIVKTVNKVNHSPIIGSIITSLGMLRYRNDELINALAVWAVKNKSIMRTQDVCSFLMTLAMIGYKPINSDAFFNELVFSLKEIDMIRSAEWLDIVWALTTLNQVSSEHISSVLNGKFISKLGERDNIVPAVKKIKLLNINATAKYLIKHYTGPQLPDDSPLFDVPIIKTKEKEIFVRAIKDTLATLFPSRDHFREDINDGTGFLTELDFFMDKKLTPVPIDQVSSKQNLIRVAIVANSYQNYCRGETMLIGPVRLHYRLLQAQMCRILDISHVDFHIDDILLKRITYLNDRIKSIVK